MKAGTGIWIASIPGMTLQAGDVIRTGDNSQAEMTFFDGSIIDLFPGTEITISDLSISGTGSTTIRMEQQIGKTFSRVKKLADATSQYEIETPAAVAAVRGSMMTVTVDADGNTVVTNEEGDIRVTAQGVEVIIPVDMKSTTKPGEAPGQPVPINETPTPTPTPPTPSGGGAGTGGEGGETPTPVYTADIRTGVQADRSEARVGQVITYTYTISNTGNLRLQNISVTDNVTGTPAYQSGDANANDYLDAGETWTYQANHIASINDASILVNTATFSASTSSAIVLVAKDHAQVTILPSDLAVVITGPADGAIVEIGPLTVSGSVNDVSLTTGTAAVNGNPRTIALSEGSFSFSANITAGQNTISVNVTNPGGATANASVMVTSSSPSLTITVSASTAEATIGGTIIYTYTVNNNGNVSLASITVTDSVSGGISFQGGDINGNGILDIGEHWTYLASHTAESADIVTLVNTATVTGTYSGTGQIVSASATASVTVTGAYQVKIVLTWNTGGNVDLHLIRPDGTIYDSTDDCYYANPHPDWGTQGSLNGDPYLDHDDTDGYGPETIYISEPFETGDYKVAAVYRSDNGAGPAVVTITVWYYGTKLEQWQKTLTNGEAWYAIDFTWSSGLFLSGTPFLLLGKKADVAQAHAGDTITYTYQVGNFGNAALANVTITDDRIQTAVTYKSGDNNSNGLLNIGEIWVYTASYQVSSGETGSLVNNATVTAIVPGTGVRVTAWASWSVNIGGP